LSPELGGQKQRDVPFASKNNYEKRSIRELLPPEFSKTFVGTITKIHSRIEERMDL